MEQTTHGAEAKPLVKAAEDGARYCLVRSHNAGVFTGWVVSRNGQEVTMRDARRIWFWCGAATLSQLAMDGVKYPEKCRFPCEVPELILTETIEIIPMTQKAKESVEGVPVWIAE